MLCITDTVKGREKWGNGRTGKNKEKKRTDRLIRNDKDQREKHLGSPRGSHIFIPFCLYQLYQCDASLAIPALSISLKYTSFFSNHHPTDANMLRRITKRKVCQVKYLM